MASVQEQTKNLFSVDDYNEDDISTKSKIIKALDNPAFGKFRSKEEIIDKAKKTGTGLLTGTLALPSDILSGAEMVNTALADYANSPTAIVLKNAFKEASDKYGRPAFDKWFSTTTGLESNPENVDQLVGEVLSPTGTFLSGAKLLKPVGKVGKQIVKDTKAFFDDMSGGDGGALATANNAPIQAIDETSKLLDKTKVTKPIETSDPIIPESEFVNAKPTINPLFAGEGTETGRKQGAKFRELEAQNKYTPEELFLKTRVYRGDDGQLRWEISTADAKLKSSWEKSLNFKKDNFNFEDEFLGITVPEKADGFYDSRASMQLSQILDFPTAYKEYYNVKGVTKYFDDVQTKTREVMSETQLSPLRNLQVYWERGDKYSNTLGYYTPSQDKITLNVRQLKAAARQTAEDYGIPFEEAFKLQVQSTLLHEVQHAVQLREGFRMGGDSDNFLPKDYDIFVSTNKQKKDRILLDIDDQFEVAIAEIAKKDSSYNALAVRNKILNEVETDFNTLYDVLVHTKTNSIDKYKNKSIEELNSISKEAEERLNNKFSTFKDYIYSEDIDRMKLGLSKNAQENIKLINIDTAATNKYYNLYGEREARLVQKRLEDRFKLNKLGGAEVAKEVESDTKFLSPEGDKDVRGRKLGQMGGFPADTKITSTKLMSDGTTFNSTIKKLETIPIKKSPALQKISKIAKLQDGPLGSRTKLDKDGLPENLLRDKKGKPLVLYYGDSGLEYDTVTKSYKPSKIPGKLKNKFEPSGRTLGVLGTGMGKSIGNFVTPNPVFASGYAGKRGSVVPVYLIADKVTNLNAKSFLDIDRAGADAKRGEVFIGDVGFDSRSFSTKSREDSIKKYGTEQYTFNRGTQVFSALTGERLTNIPTINQNIRNKLLKLNQAEEDTLLKKMSPKEQLQYKAKKSYIEDIDDEYFIEDMFKLDRKGDIARNEKKRNLAKGGVTMDNQMEMFQDGGLKDEGGTIDPVSGNDVPSGSTQEEVRDDIPAQLSEGEFVFPADVVRFIGLEKLMMMRQEAKAGLKRMEEMGQMGNSDEATIPDDTPFDINDLDMEDDDTVEMAQGGVIQAANGTFVNTAPNVMYNPSQFAGQNLPSQQNNPNAQPISYNAPVYNPVPAGSYTPTYYNQLNQGNDNVASFENLVGSNYGQYDEMRKYTSESGLVLNIPFKAGQPIYPIPEGYTYVDPEATKTEEVKTVTPTPQTTKVTQQDDGDDDPDARIGAVDLVGDPLSYKSLFNPDALDKTLRRYAGMQVGLFNMKDALSRGFKDQVNVNEITLNAAREALKSIKASGVYGSNVNLGTLDTDQRDTINNYLTNVSDSVQSLLTTTDADGNTTAITLETLENRAATIEKQAKAAGIDVTDLNKNFPKVSKPSATVKNPMAMRNYAKQLAFRAGILNRAIVDEFQKDKGVYAKDSQDAKDNIEEIKKNEAKAKENFAYAENRGEPIESSYDSSDYSPSTSFGGEQTTAEQQEDAGGSFVGDDPFNKGGLAGKKKSKTKKMKRGGLASRK